MRDAHIVDSDATSNIIAASPSMASAKIAFAMGYAVPAHLRSRSGRARHSLWQAAAQRCIFCRKPYFMA